MIRNIQGYLKTAVIAIQLGLLAQLIWRYSIEGAGFLRLFMLLSAGFVIHASLPREWRMRFYALLSVVSVIAITGMQSGLWLLALGVGFITLCHLPIPFYFRASLVVVVAGMLAVMRAGYIDAPWSDAVWPILGSMFMFRLIVYLYDLRHGKVEFSMVRSISYFFMLPNICFPLYPVIDYTRFNRHYYDEDDHRIYQRGVKWIFRGIIHLLLYRLVYHLFVLDPAEVAGLVQFIQYSLAAFLLYLRVSGLFHLIVGVLLLFGFNLHETHHLYYLSASFTDFWRRINIYWKDFMMKLFYYPVRFALKGLGETRAIVISTIIVFVGTWFLHAYQWFWLRGDLLLELHDGLFWTLLAGLVIVNSVYDLKYPPLRALGRRSWNFHRMVAVTCRTTATFIVICLLWSLWSSDSLKQWLGMVSTTGMPGVLLFVMPVMLFTVSRLMRPLEQNAVTPGAIARARPAGESFPLSVGITVVGVCVLSLLSHPYVYERSPYFIGVGVRMALNTGLNKRDRAIMDRGYYEHLLAVNRQNSALRELFTQKPSDWLDIADTTVWRVREDFMGGELAPGKESVLKGQPFIVNEAGMRDDSYSVEKPAGTIRIAALGASTLVGSGVRADEDFESRFERMANEGLRGDVANRFEVLNFAIPSALGLRQLMLLQERVLSYHPDIVFYFAQIHDLTFSLNNITTAVKKGYPVPFDFVEDILRSEGITSDMWSEGIEQRMVKHREEIIRQTYSRMAQVCHDSGIVPVWIYLPWTDEHGLSAQANQLMQYARDAGFVVLDLADAYMGQTESDLWLKEWDHHANPAGHELLSRTLYQQVYNNQNSIFRGIVLNPLPDVSGSTETANE